MVGLALSSHSSRAAIIVQNQRQRIDLLASAVGGQTGIGDQQQINHFAPEGFTTFIKTDSTNASDSGNNGTATGRSTGSTNTTFTLSNDELSLNSNTSFETLGTFSPAQNPKGVVGGGFGQGSTSMSFGIALTDRAYEYSFSGSFDHALSGPNSRSNGRARFSGGFPTVTPLDIFDHQTSGGGSVPISDSGTLQPGSYFLDLDFDVSASAGPSLPGSSSGNGGLNFELTLRPVPPVIRWIQPAGGTFAVGSNWDGGRAPTAEDEARIDLPGTYTITLDQNVTNRRMQGHGSGVNGSLDLNGRNYTVDELLVGGLAGDNVSLDVTDGGGIGVRRRRSARQRFCRR